MIEKIKYWLFQKGKDCKRCCLRCRHYDICRWDVLGNVGLQSEKTITLLAIENSKPHKDGLLFRICQYVEFKQKTTKKQKEWLEYLRQQGYYTAVCYGWQPAAQLIEQYLLHSDELIKEQETVTMR